MSQSNGLHQRLSFMDLGENDAQQSGVLAGAAIAAMGEIPAALKTTPIASSETWEEF